jgi:segregation and condensation protein A
MEFTVKLDRYEGPYTKLLELIEQKKLSITEISLVSVADDYIAYIRTLDQKKVFDISQFVVVASTLMLMKAKSLLPGVIYTEDEERQVGDLEKKLELYAMLMKACGGIRGIYMKNILYSKRRSSPKKVALYVPDPRVTPTFLQSIAELTLASFVTPKALVRVAVEQALRIENVIERLLDRIKNAQSVTLQSLANGTSNFEEQKKLLIVNFIALLELLKTGQLEATQGVSGGEININKL